MPMEEIADWETSTNIGEGAPSEPPVTPQATTPTPAAPEEPTEPVEADDELNEPEAGARDRRGRYRPRSQRATVEDVPIIAQLTKELRGIEKELGLQIDPKDSPRVRELKIRVELAKAARDAKKGAAPASPSGLSQPPKAPEARKAETTAFTEPQPKLEDFADQADPYAAHILALTRWERKKEVFEATQAEAQSAAKRAADTHQQEFQRWIGDVQTSHRTRLSAYLSAHTEAKTLLDAEVAKPAHEQLPITPLMQIAIQLHDRGPEFMLDLLQHRDVADALALETAAVPIFDAAGQLSPFVASLQRRLLTRILAASTGSAPARPVVAPRPPNPVRTGPQPPAEELPGDDASLEAHEKAFYRDPRQRRR